MSCNAYLSGWEEKRKEGNKKWEFLQQRATPHENNLAFIEGEDHKGQRLLKESWMKAETGIEFERRGKEKKAPSRKLRGVLFWRFSSFTVLGHGEKLSSFILYTCLWASSINWETLILRPHSAIRLGSITRLGSNKTENITVQMKTSSLKHF